jgi:hypothetical protein
MPLTVPNLSENRAGKLLINAVISTECNDSSGNDPHRRLPRTSFEHRHAGELHLAMSKVSKGKFTSGWKRKL